VRELACGFPLWSLSVELVLLLAAANPLKLAHIPDPGGYEFDFDLPRNRLHEMVCAFVLL
jgi:hypothetical protein